MEVSLAPSPGRLLRLGFRHDRCDFSALGAAKTLSAVRNLGVVREALVRAGGEAPFDECFHRTELSRGGMAPDEWTDFDLGGGAHRLSARSNRAAFDLYARVRFLHATRRQPEHAPHYLEF